MYQPYSVTLLLYLMSLQVLAVLSGHHLVCISHKTGVCVCARARVCVCVSVFASTYVLCDVHAWWWPVRTAKTCSDIKRSKSVMLDGWVDVSILFTWNQKVHHDRHKNSQLLKHLHTYQVSYLTESALTAAPCCLDEWKMGYLTHKSDWHG